MRYGCLRSLCLQLPVNVPEKSWITFNYAINNCGVCRDILCNDVAFKGFEGIHISCLHTHDFGVTLF